MQNQLAGLIEFQPIRACERDSEPGYVGFRRDHQIELEAAPTSAILHVYAVQHTVEPDSLPTSHVASPSAWIDADQIIQTGGCLLLGHAREVLSCAEDLHPDRARVTAPVGCRQDGHLRPPARATYPGPRASQPKRDCSNSTGKVRAVREYENGSAPKRTSDPAITSARARAPRTQIVLTLCRLLYQSSRCWRWGQALSRGYALSPANRLVQNLRLDLTASTSNVAPRVRRRRRIVADRSSGPRPAVSGTRPTRAISPLIGSLP